MIRGMDRRRALIFIMVNVFVSACVTGTILFWYDRNVRATSAVPVFVPPAQVDSTGGAPQNESNPINGIQVVSVVGADNLGAEVIILRYLGEGQVNLGGWSLKDEDGNICLFPSITLVKEGAVQVHTSAGTNTVIDLYWNMTEPVWKSGETASLYDSSGKLLVTYKVP
jgi:hypothetical protein